MAEKQKSRAELENELRLARTYNVWSGVSPVLIEGIRWIGLAAVFGFIYLSIASLAGKKTAADINLSAIANANNAVAWIFGSIGIGYGWRQRRLAKGTIDSLRKRVNLLESKLDPTGSALNGVEGPTVGTRNGVEGQ